MSEQGPRHRDPSGAPQWLLVVFGILGGVLITATVNGLVRGDLDSNAQALGAMTSLVSLASGLLVYLSRRTNGGDDEK